jgi:hypothetical protein
LDLSQIVINERTTNPFFRTTFKNGSQSCQEGVQIFINHGASGRSSFFLIQWKCMDKKLHRKIFCLSLLVALFIAACSFCSGELTPGATDGDCMTSSAHKIHRPLLSQWTALRFGQKHQNSGNGNGNGGGDYSRFRLLHAHSLCFAPRTISMEMSAKNCLRRHCDSKRFLALNVLLI